MTISLAKGGNISLSKTDPSLKTIAIGLFWNARVTDGAAYDLDASAFLLDKNGVCQAPGKNFIFYGNLRTPDGAVVHQGDNRTGAGDGDDETIVVDLTKIAADIERIVITVTIDNAVALKQSFGQVNGAGIRLVNQETNVEVVRYDLSEDASTVAAMQFGELYRGSTPGEWKFRALGTGYDGGLSALCKSFGFDAS